MSYNSDMSDNAIMARYTKANEISIITSDRISFSSIQDVRDLVIERNKEKETLFKLADEIIRLELIIEQLQPGYFDSKLREDGN